MSDLHLEFLHFTPQQIDSDVVVLAGDIHSKHHGFEWARVTFPASQIVYVLGNHEYYHGEYESVLQRSRLEASKFDVHLLECDEVVIGRVRFLGTTLWTDFEIDQTSPGIPSFPMWYADRNMSDFRLITYVDRRLRAELTRDIHFRSRSWLHERLAQPFSGETVVVTHHLPHRRSIHPRYAGNPLNPAFASHMRDLVCPPVDLWVHGHTHESCDYLIDGTRVICNPRGYGPGEINPAFNAQVIVDLGQR
jgi:predicted phosphodiesterase